MDFEEYTQEFEIEFEEGLKVYENDYNELQNKPSIEGVTLQGNKTAAQLGLVKASELAEVATSGDYEDLTNKPTIPTKTSDLENDSNFITRFVNNLVNYFTKTEVNTALDLKADKSTTYTKTEVNTALADKVDKITGKSLSSNDFTDELKNKLDGIETGADVTDTSNVNSSILGNVKTTLDSILVPFAQYYLGEQTTVSLTLPSTANTGEQITVVFYSGSTATTLTLSGSYLGTLPTPGVSQRVELNLLYDGTNWCLLSNTMGVE